MPRNKPKRTKHSKGKAKSVNSGLGRAIANKYGRKDVENNASGRQKRSDKPMTNLSGLDPSNPASKTGYKLKSITNTNSVDNFVDEAIEYSKYQSLKAAAILNNANNAQNSEEIASVVDEDVKLIVQMEDRQEQERLYSLELKESEIFDYQNLPIPHRPAWTSTTSKEELLFNEEKAFLEWRRGLAKTAQTTQLSLTPYEKNLEVWRQLWRVLEKSHLVVVIIDARNPLAYINNDLLFYVKQLDQRKRILLLMNKADYLTPLQRQYWSQYFDSRRIDFAYFSARREEIRLDLLSKSQREHVTDATLDSAKKNVDTELEPAPDAPAAAVAAAVAAGDAAEAEAPEDAEKAAKSDVEPKDSKDVKDAKDAKDGQNEGTDEKEDEVRSNQMKKKKSKFQRQTHVLNIDELLDKFRAKIDLNKFDKKEMDSTRSEASGATGANGKGSICVGMVGYPNVGKSSVINVLCGAKKVGVGGRPGKTKHFQTLLIAEDVMLCDCPGLVFPTLMASKSDLVLNGVLPIDNLTDFIAPARLMVNRITRMNSNQFATVYNLKLGHIGTGSVYGGKRNRMMTVFDVLDAYCYQKSLVTKLRVPNRTQAARIMLKDFVKGKLLYCHPPPKLNEKEQNIFYNGTLLAEPVDEIDVRRKLKASFLSPHAPTSGAAESVASNATDTDILQRMEDVADVGSISVGNGGSGSDALMASLKDVANSELLSNKSGNDGLSIGSRIDSAEFDNRDDLDLEDIDNTEITDGTEKTGGTGGTDITDEEFMMHWKHPLDDSQGQLGASKKKHEKKARVLRKIEKRQQKQNRQFRHDSDNFAGGSNAVVISSAPGTAPKNGPALV